jgi:hypothetical protein
VLRTAVRLAGGATSTRIRRTLRVPSLGPVGAEGGPVDDQVAGRIRRSSGRPLDDTTRSTMEAGFGVDLANVRVHTGPDADEISRSLGASAFTLGSDIFFGAGRFEPGTAAGQHLLAHELAHTMQQTGASAQRHLDALVLRDLAVPAKPATVAELLAAARASTGGAPSLMDELTTLNKLNQMSATPSATLGTAAAAASTALQGADVDVAHARLTEFVDEANTESGRLQDELDELKNRYRQLHLLLQQEIAKPGLFTPKAYTDAMVIMKRVVFAKTDKEFAVAAHELHTFAGKNEEYESWVKSQTVKSLPKAEEEAKPKPGRTTLGGLLAVANQGTTGGQRYTRDRNWGGGYTYHVSIAFRNDSSRKAKSAKPTHAPIIIDTIHVTFRSGGHEPRFWWNPTSAGVYPRTPTQSGGPAPGMEAGAIAAVDAVVGRINCSLV